MRRLATLALATVLLSGCLTSVTSPYHWSQLSGRNGGAGGGEQVVWLMTAPDAAYPQVHQALNWAAYAWSVSSPYVEVRVLGSAWCSSYPWEDCAQVFLGTVEATYGKSAITQRGVTASGHILPGQYTYIQFDFGIIQWWDMNLAGQTGCHEVGHLLGLNHGDDGGNGPCVGGWPTQVDVDNVTAMYAHGDIVL